MTLCYPEHKISLGGAIALKFCKDTCISLLGILDINEGETFETIGEEQKAIEDSH